MSTRQVKLGDGYLTLDPTTSGSKELGEQVTSVKFDPKPSTGDATTVLTGAVIAGDYTEAPVLTGTLVPDFGETDSVQEWLITNAGKTFDFDFVPNNLKGKKITGTCQVVAVAIGGDVKKADTIDFEFPVMEYDIAAVAAPLS